MDGNAAQYALVEEIRRSWKRFAAIDKHRAVERPAGSAEPCGMVGALRALWAGAVGLRRTTGAQRSGCPGRDTGDIHRVCPRLPGGQVQSGTRTAAVMAVRDYPEQGAGYPA